MTALPAILLQIQNNGGAKPSGTLFKSSNHNKLKLGLKLPPYCFKLIMAHLFTSCDTNKINVRFQNNNKLKLGLGWSQGVCHILFTSRDRLG
jgi:hypothetical protein